VFVAEAGENLLAIHQGANDGFRCVSVYCYKGPDTGKGFVILCNGDSSAVSSVAQISQFILTHLQMSGIDSSKYKTQFDMSKIPTEEIVNRGYRDLVFSAFLPNLPEKIESDATIDPLAQFNLLNGATFVSVTDQSFARLENLTSRRMPVFDPMLYGKQGKIMDSWETRRHNRTPINDPHDVAIFRLREAVPVRYAYISTKYHFGNQVLYVAVDGSIEENESNDDWREIFPKIRLEGHSWILVTSPLSMYATPYARIRVRIYPDGGLSRLYLFNDDSLPRDLRSSFPSLSQAKCTRYEDAIPTPVKPITPKFHTSPEMIRENIARLRVGQLFDCASAAFGGRIVSASNEHYGPAVQVISPYLPINMFDGLESMRSREPNHSENVVIELALPSRVERIDLDFHYFVHNNPLEIEIEATDIEEKTFAVVNRVYVKNYAANIWSHELDDNLRNRQIKQLSVKIYPDGGFNRIHVWSYYTGGQCPRAMKSNL